MLHFLNTTAPYDTPQNVSAAVQGSTSIVLSWLPPQSDLINGVLRYYHVLVTDFSGTVVYDMLLDEDSLEALVLGLQPYSEYRCTVTAVTVEEGPSAAIEIRTLEDGKDRNTSSEKGQN